MTDHDVLKIFQAEKALLNGHFLLSSGLHSPRYLQCALVLQKPAVAEKLAKALAKKLPKGKIDAVIGPALGGVLVAHELARALKTRALFAERVESAFAVRRGFEIKKDERLLVVEDVVTTGKSTREVIELVKTYGAKIAGVASLVDRSGGQVRFECGFTALVQVDVPTYAADACPLCREGKIPLVKPGSRPQPATPRA